MSSHQNIQSQPSRDVVAQPTINTLQDEDIPAISSSSHDTSSTSSCLPDTDSLSLVPTAAPPAPSTSPRSQNEQNLLTPPSSHSTFFTTDSLPETDELSPVPAAAASALPTSPHLQRIQELYGSPLRSVDRVTRWISEDDSLPPFFYSPIPSKDWIEHEALEDENWLSPSPSGSFMADSPELEAGDDFDVDSAQAKVVGSKQQAEVFVSTRCPRCGEGLETYHYCERCFEIRGEHITASPAQASWPSSRRHQTRADEQTGLESPAESAANPGPHDDRANSEGISPIESLPPPEFPALYRTPSYPRIYHTPRETPEARRHTPENVYNEYSSPCNFVYLY
ncbi:hypothetical protein BU23DRAFT_642711 [Bimuria novae-zelandiae CBS 107.79]|uniref:Uncharacterized protein n=1 Tax=Bimuria novae-zelandiae CBS 107.79 TaxID=1447943 RepID=A0A6A5VUE2_9PLEO|nr:hypothetical protein BU23DRAFT_642711 [Bimuria novae-zelandiae CBS 107.79]